MKRMQHVIGLLVLTSLLLIGCAPQGQVMQSGEYFWVPGVTGMYHSKQEAEQALATVLSPNNNQKSEIYPKKTVELQIVNNDGIGIEGASVEYYTNSNTISLKKEDGKLVTDKTGIVTKLLANDKYYELYSKFPSKSSYVRIHYKIEKEGFRPIIIEQNIEPSQTEKISKRIILQNIKPISNNIEGGLSFATNALPINYQGSNILEVLSKIGPNHSKFQNIVGRTWYDVNEDMKIHNNYSYAKSNERDTEPVAANKIYAFKIDDNSIVISNHKIKILGNNNKYRVIAYTDSGSYIGSNAFGVMANVNKYSELTCNVCPMNSDNQSIIVDMPDNKGNFGVVFICKPFRYNNEYKYIIIDGVSVKPTLSDPNDIASFNKTLNVELYEIWVYDKESGVIIKKKNLYQAKQ